MADVGAAKTNHNVNTETSWLEMESLVKLSFNITTNFNA